MAESIKSIVVAEEAIISKIYLIRDKKVMLDRDLAELYGVETRVLNQAVRRNERRFPDDFMFQLTMKELEDWKSQNVISNKERMGLRRPPLAFTEQGVAQGGKLQKHDQDIRLIFEYLKQLLNPPQEPRPRVGFRRKDEQD